MIGWTQAGALGAEGGAIMLVHIPGVAFWLAVRAHEDAGTLPHPAVEGFHAKRALVACLVAEVFL